MEQFSDALDSLNQINADIVDKDGFFFNMNTLKANCYYRLKLYKEALEIHFTLLNSYCNNNLYNKLIVIGNIIGIYRDTNDLTNMRKYLLRAMSIITNHEFDEDNYSLDSVYYDLAVSNIMIDNEEDTLILLNKALLNSKKQKKYKVEYDCLNSMFDIYLKHENYEKLKELKVLVQDLISKHAK